MKKRFKVIFGIVLFFILYLLINVKDVCAASVSLTPNQTVQKGETVTITASVNAGAWDLTLSGAGKSVRIFGNTSVANNASDSKSITFIANETTTITLSGQIKDFYAPDEQKPEDIYNTTTITVESTPNTDNTGSGSTGTSNSSSNNNTTAKSSNANLSNLGIRPNDFSGFRPGTTTYNVTVPNETETIEVYANKAESAQTISGTGTKTLNEGVNTFNVVVTAADGQTKKTYTINVTREASDEETTDENEEQPLEDPTNIFGLSSLDITGVTLTPEFQTDVYEYNVDVTSDINKLELQTVATEANANVEITGNENFQEGENIVTIIVTDESGENTVTYQIIVNKKAAVEETTEEEPATDWRKIICIGLIALLVIVVIIIIIVKRRRNNAEVQEYMGLYNNDDEFDDEDNYNNNFNKMNNDFIDDNYNYQDNNTTEFNSTTDKEDTIEDTTEYSTKDIAENIENDENNEEETKSTHIIPDEFFEDDEPPVKKKRSKGKRFK